MKYSNQPSLYGSIVSGRWLISQGPHTELRALHNKGRNLDEKWAQSLYLCSMGDCTNVACSIRWVCTKRSFFYFL